MIQCTSDGRIDCLPSKLIFDDMVDHVHYGMVNLSNREMHNADDALIDYVVFDH
jgi:hypothetical protein